MSGTAGQEPGGGGWIRTSVGVRQRIYSPSPLATRAPLRPAPDPAATGSARGWPRAERTNGISTALSTLRPSATAPKRACCRQCEPDDARARTRASGHRAKAETRPDPTGCTASTPLRPPAPTRNVGCAACSPLPLPRIASLKRCQGDCPLTQNPPPRKRSPRCFHQVLFTRGLLPSPIRSPHRRSQRHWQRTPAR